MASRRSRPWRTLAALAILGAAFLDVRRSHLLAAPTAAEDCSPGQVARSYTELSRAEVERRCTRVIARDSLGPFRIGTPKQQLLDELTAGGVRRITLRPAIGRALDIAAPELSALIESCDGILIRAGEEPDPLRVEFEGATVKRAFGGAVELDPLRASVTVGRSRRDVLATLEQYKGRHTLSVEAFVPYGDDVAIPPEPEALGRTLRADRWRFDAPPSLCGFDAYYSRVELVFESGRLARLEHFCFPYELP